MRCSFLVFYLARHRSFPEVLALLTSVSMDRAFDLHLSAAFKPGLGSKPPWDPMACRASALGVSGGSGWLVLFFFFWRFMCVLYSIGRYMVVVWVLFVFL